MPRKLEAPFAPSIYTPSFAHTQTKPRILSFLFSSIALYFIHFIFRSVDCLIVLKDQVAFAVLRRIMADLEEIRRIYDMVDENADGMVSVDEMCGFINKLGIPMSEQDLRCMLNDPVQGHLPFEEFVDLYHSILNNHEDGEEKDESEDLMEAFRVFDQDKDGYISSDELQNVLCTMGLIPRVQDSQHCEKMICRFDSDCNGVLDFSEFKNMMSSKLSMG